MIHAKTDLRLYFVRHAETERNIEQHLIGGRSEDSPLSERGKLQAIALGRRFVREEIFFDAVYSSTSLRAVHTAELMSREIQFPLDKIVPVPALLELSQGDWEGRPRREVLSPDTLRYIGRKGYLFIPPNGESQRMVERRVSNWLEDEILYNNMYLNSRQRIAIVSHSMALKALFHYIMGFDEKFIYRIWLYNASISEMVFNGEGWHPIKIIDCAHLLEIGYLED